MISGVNRDYGLRRSTTIVAMSIVSLVFLSAISGVLLAFYYQPAAGEAYRSISRIATDVNFGSIVYGVHHYAGNFTIVLGLVQMVLMFLSRQSCLSWTVSWTSGILLILAGIALAWTAMVLGWTQDGFWRLSVELGIIESIPVVGSTLRELLTGGGGINTDTLQRMYALHSYVLSVGAVALSAVHLWGALRQDREEKQSLRDRRKAKVESELDRIVRDLDRMEETIDRR
ncbi:MAG: cytochrome bc complex cytochrome b subunit [Cyanobacteria bacterium SID2]|nr:cytochrome bc complex cytochrome b subunit [Cyanobacteria bacterium SID2]MBP0005639.1 cytochrome bc complex cytochrome b subunit [Cyanobacteria bacterium SBC]